MVDIGLLLAYGDSGAPVLQDGLGWDTAAQGPKPKEASVTGSDLRDDGADPNDLSAQGWGLVVPDDDALGDRLRALIGPLVEERKRQTGREPRVYKVPRGMDAEASAKWWNDVYQHEDVKDHERPRYLLALGDADLISWDFQQRLALDIFIGRLAFQREEDYAAYAHKVLAHERSKAAPGARALFYTVRDGTAATRAGHLGLMTPAVGNARESRDQGELNAREIEWLDEETPDISADDFLRAAAQSAPTMLFSISHGSGPPRRGWRSVEEQHRFQGQMCLLDMHKLTHEDVAERAFLPGGAWFYFACLGAGTPGESAYHHWLAHLKQVGLFSGPLDDVLRSLPAEGERPFMARLPQAALANPNGPLSIIGHVDLAWTFGFQEYVIKDNRTIARDRPSRFQGIFRSLVEGKRLGAGYTALQRQLSNTNADLTGIYNQQERARSRGMVQEEDRAKKMKRAALWMERQDLSAYVLLGDPAVRLNVDPTRAQPSVSAPMASVAAMVTGPPAPAPPPAPSVKPASHVKKLGVEAMEKAIFPIFTEDTTAKKVAEKLGVETDDVKAWLAAYQQAGRKALNDL